MSTKARRMTNPQQLQMIIFLTLMGVLQTLSQKLPAGAYHADRERMVDIIHYKADLNIDLPAGRVEGEATVTLCPLRMIDTVSLDAWHLNIHGVRDARSGIPLGFRSGQRVLNIAFPMAPGDTITLAVQYDCTPRAGMYFARDQRHAGQWYAYTYGEGGLHANWLPIYNDVNDKFTTEMVVTVLPPNIVLSNGALVDEKNLSNGQGQYHWRQDLPHSDYLIALYVGDFEEGKLQPAFGSIPLSYWVPRGRLGEGASVFSTTTRMVEFYSQRFSYRYPWNKYDQIAIPDYAIGAMEHTGITGHRDCVLRESGAPLDFGPPRFTEYSTPWTAEATISHELAHHWFGDNLTCQNLSEIWLNESFASYLMMLWDEESLGRQQLQFDVQLALRHYLDYVDKKHVIRSQEYHFFDNQDVIYNEEHTYLKGAALLHMLRFALGDEAFFRGLSYYLHKHEFSNVGSNDLKIAFEESTGKNLDWFFEQWVTGGGHPVLEVSYTYLPVQKLIDLSIKQVQPLVTGQGLFTLPGSVTIVTPSKRYTRKIQVRGEDDHFLFPANERPLMVSLDGAGNLVADIRFEKGIDELQYQAMHDSLPGRLRALRQMANRYPGSDVTLKTLEERLSRHHFWADAAEAAELLGTIRSPAAEMLLAKVMKSGDYRVRKAAVLALEKTGTKGAEQMLLEVVRTDPSSDVVATAIVVLAKRKYPLDEDFLNGQLTRKSWYDEIIIACLNAIEERKAREHVPALKKYAGQSHNQSVRNAALSSWAVCSPSDPQLHKELASLAESAPRVLQLKAIQLLGTVGATESLGILKKIVDDDFDADMTVAAKTSVESLERIMNAQ
jgi:aminopeptidase N